MQPNKPKTYARLMIALTGLCWFFGLGRVTLHEGDGDFAPRYVCFPLPYYVVQAISQRLQELNYEHKLFPADGRKPACLHIPFNQHWLGKTLAVCKQIEADIYGNTP